MDVNRTNISNAEKLTHLDLPINSDIREKKSLPPYDVLYDFHEIFMGYISDDDKQYNKYSFYSRMAEQNQVTFDDTVTKRFQQLERIAESLRLLVQTFQQPNRAINQQSRILPSLVPNAALPILEEELNLPTLDVTTAENVADVGTAPVIPPTVSIEDPSERTLARVEIDGLIARSRAESAALDSEQLNHLRCSQLVSTATPSTSTPEPEAKCQRVENDGPKIPKLILRCIDLRTGPPHMVRKYAPLSAFEDKKKRRSKHLRKRKSRSFHTFARSVKKMRLLPHLHSPYASDSGTTAYPSDSSSDNGYSSGSTSSDGIPNLSNTVSSFEPLFQDGDDNSLLSSSSSSVEELYEPTPPSQSSGDVGGRMCRAKPVPRVFPPPPAELLHSQPDHLLIDLTEDDDFDALAEAEAAELKLFHEAGAETDDADAKTYD